jgi:ferredoxin/flavodoxin
MRADILGNSIDIVYYSGTGSTLQAAECFDEVCRREGWDVRMYRLFQNKEVQLREDSILLLIFAVHACNALEPVYRFLDELPAGKNREAAVISVSGGGEVSPNTACRMSSIRRLEKKGYPVFYEKMLVMPSNWIVGLEKPLAQHLLYALPQKVESAVRDITNHTTVRSKPILIDRLFSRLGEGEKAGARQFGKRILVTENCTGCGLCASQCPAANIQMNGKKPEFGNNCQLCLNCIYSCPGKALKPGIGRFVVIREGYPIREYQAVKSFSSSSEIQKATKGFLWSGVRKYLQET